MSCASCRCKGAPRHPSSLTMVLSRSSCLHCCIHYIYIYIYIHTCIHTYTYIHTYRQVQARRAHRAQLCVCIHTYTHIHTYIHTHIHTHTYIHTGRYKHAVRIARSVGATQDLARLALQVLYTLNPTPLTPNRGLPEVSRGLPEGDLWSICIDV